MANSWEKNRTHSEQRVAFFVATAVLVAFPGNKKVQQMQYAAWRGLNRLTCAWPLIAHEFPHNVDDFHILADRRRNARRNEDA